MIREADVDGDGQINCAFRVANAHIATFDNRALLSHSLTPFATHRRGIRQDDDVQLSDFHPTHFPWKSAFGVNVSL